MDTRVGTSELIDLMVSFIVLTFAFAMRGLSIPSAEMLVICAIGVGTGFILHELAHKFMAQRYGYWAEYKMSMMGLIMTLAMAAFFGFVFAAPGAVMIRKVNYSPVQSTYSYNDDAYWDSMDRRTGKEEGWIAAAGPLTNIGLAAFFFAALMSGLLPSELLIRAAFYAMFINVSLAAFNMIPIDPFDGAKVLRANPLMWAVIGLPAIGLALILLFAPGLLMGFIF